MSRPLFLSDQIPRSFSNIVTSWLPVVGREANLGYVLSQFCSDCCGIGETGVRQWLSNIFELIVYEYSVIFYSVQNSDLMSPRQLCNDLLHKLLVGVGFGERPHILEVSATKAMHVGEGRCQIL